MNKQIGQMQDAPVSHCPGLAGCSSWALGRPSGRQGGSPPEGREASARLALAQVESLDLKRSSFASARFVQLYLDLPGCPELL